jgi:hypothetical protein
MADTDLHQLIGKMFLELNALRAEVQQLRCELAESQQQQSQQVSQPTETWTGPAAAVEALRSEGIKSQSHLQALRLAGAFNESKGEIRNISQGQRPTWQYHLPKCRTALRRYYSRLAG